MSEKRQQAPNAHIVVYLASTHNRGRRFPERRRQSPVGADGLPKAAKKGNLFQSEPNFFETNVKEFFDLNKGIRIPVEDDPFFETGGNRKKETDISCVSTITHWIRWIAFCLIRF